ncbi:hypothetical protein BDV93DRAFT_139782 [Ceratobasidium sp. AG-I]|nr:hypothetical protein BDV93DRAFT_139782 [Ceratobasidium sp. AG-I]
MAQSSNDGSPELPSGVPPELNTRSFVQYTRAELLYLSKSPLVKIPNGMPAFKDWFGEWTDTGTTARKEPASEPLGQLSRDRARFRRDTEEGDGTRESISGRPAFKGALSFSQASGSAMGSMGSFRHQSSLRLESDARREEREREREREGRRDTENLRNLSVQFDRERRDRDAAPHLPRAVSGASNASGRDAKTRDVARDSREPAKDSTRDVRRGRGDDTNDWRRARDDDRQRSRSRQRRGDREPANGQKRERDGWVPSDDRRAVSGAAGRRRGGLEERLEGKSKDDRAPIRNDRDRSGREEQEPAWMGDYVPETGGQGILGSGAEDGIQAWKRELKEKERGNQGGDDELLEDDSLGGLEDEVGRMQLVEERAKQEKLESDDGLDEIQRFKKLMQASDKQRRDEAERIARELAGKANFSPELEEHAPTNGTADTQPPLPALSGPPGLIKSTTESQSAPTPPPTTDPSIPTNGRVGGVSLASPNWHVPTSVTPSTTTPSNSSTGWAQSGAPGPDSSPPNPRLSPVQPRRFTQDGGLPPMGNQDGAQVGTRSTSRFANFFGDKQRDPAPPRFNENSASNSPHSSFLPGSNEPQLLDSLLARLAESQIRPQTQAAPQSQDRSFAQRSQGIPSQQAQYGNALAQNTMNMQHAQPPLIQHQRAQLSLHQQQHNQCTAWGATVLPLEVTAMGHPR